MCILLQILASVCTVVVQDMVVDVPFPIMVSMFTGTERVSAPTVALLELEVDAPSPPLVIM